MKNGEFIIYRGQNCKFIGEDSNGWSVIQLDGGYSAIENKYIILEDDGKYYYFNGPEIGQQVKLTYFQLHQVGRITKIEKDSVAVQHEWLGEIMETKCSKETFYKLFAWRNGSWYEREHSNK